MENTTFYFEKGTIFFFLTLFLSMPRTLDQTCRGETEWSPGPIRFKLNFRLNQGARFSEVLITKFSLLKDIFATCKVFSGVLMFPPTELDQACFLELPVPVDHLDHLDHLGRTQCTTIGK